MEFDKSKVYTALNADELKEGDIVFVSDYISSLKKEVEKGTNTYKLEGISDVVKIDGNLISMSELFNGYTYMDGSRCGIQE